MNTLIDIFFSNQALLLLTYVSIFFAVALLIHNLLPDEKVQAAKKMLDVADEGSRVNRILLLKILRPLITPLSRFFIETHRPIITTYKLARRRNLIAADLLREITPEEFIAFKLLMMLIIPAMVHYISTILNYHLAWGWYPCLLLLGFFAPELWLFELVKKRQRAIFRALPYTMDMLTLSVEAGLDFIAALKRVTSRMHETPLISELKIMLNEISLGTSRADALRNFSTRVQMKEISSFTTLLIQADQLGASIGPVLRAQADSLRTTRFQLAEMRGARAALMILFPLILFILPTTVLVLLAPLIVRVMTQGLTGLF